MTIHDVGAHAGGLFIAMEFVAGTDLRRWLAARDPARPAAEIIAQFVLAGRGLVAAHAAGLVHRDFKPDNVLVDPATGRTVVTDFGLARAGAEVTSTGDARGDAAIHLTQTGAIAGTPLYMAPEQFTGARLTPACDQFSFCVALYEALYGKRPFAGTTLHAIMAAVTEQPPEAPPTHAEVSERTRAAIMRGLARDPAERHPSMSVLVAELEAATTPGAPAAAAPPRPPRLARTVALGLGGVAVLAGALVFATRGTTPTTPGGAGPSTATPVADACTANAARVDAIWTPAVRTVAAKQLAGDPLATGDVAQIDAFVAHWRTLRVDACHADHAPTADCLDRALAALESVPSTIAHPGERRTWIELPSLDRCMHAAPSLPAVADLHEVLEHVNNGFFVRPDAGAYAIVIDRAVRIVDISSQREHTVRIPDGWDVEMWLDAQHLLVIRGANEQAGTLDVASGAVAAWPDSHPHALPSSPDATLTLDVADGALVIRSMLAGGPPPRIIATGLDQIPGEIVRPIYNAGWSPDGTRIAVLQAGDPQRVIAYDLSAPDRVTTLVDRPFRGFQTLKGTFELGWLDNHRLVVESAGDLKRAGSSLWLFSDAGTTRFSDPPTLLVKAGPRTGYAHMELRGGHVFGKEVAMHEAITRIAGGHATPLAHSIDTLLVGVTSDDRTVLGQRDGVTEALAVADGATTTLPAGTEHIRGDHLLTLHPCPDGPSSCLDERAISGDVRPLGPVPRDTALSCAQSTCVATSATAETLTVRRLGVDGTFGDAVALPIEHADDLELRPSPDGTRIAAVLLRGTHHRVETIALAKPHAREVWREKDPRCSPMLLAWADDTTLDVSEYCAGAPSRVVQLTHGQPPRVVYETPDWILRLAAAANGTVYVGTRTFAARLVEITGI